jgi:isopenicillin-N epimerase
VTTNPLWGDDWPAVRAAWDLDPDVAHLNHGSFGAVPRAVREAQDARRAEVERDPNRFFTRTLMPALDDAKQTAASFLRVDPGGLAFVPNATAGLAIALASVPLREGQEIVLTDHAYAAAVHAAEQASRRTGAVLAVVPLGLPASEEELIERVLAAVNERTAAVVVDRIASPTGMRLPVTDLCTALRARDVTTIIDAAHAPGTLAEGPGDLGPDMWVGTFHKWPCAPHGTAALWVTESWRPHVEPLAPSSEPPAVFPDNLAWQGTQDYSAWLTVPDALALLEGLGWERLRSHNRALARAGAAAVADALGTSVVLPDGMFEAMALLGLPDGVATTRDGARALAARIASELAAEVAVVAWGGRGWLRLSAHAYNRPGEYEALAVGLRRLLSQ